VPRVDSMEAELSGRAVGWSGHRPMSIMAMVETEVTAKLRAKCAVFSVL
jgi:hypothetical protein